MDYCSNQKDIFYFSKASMVSIIKKGKIKLVLDFSLVDRMPKTTPKLTTTTRGRTERGISYTTTTSTTFKPTTTTNVPLDSVIELESGEPFSCGVKPHITKKPRSMLKIIGGSTSMRNSWPWQVFISDGKYGCGASLINRQVLYPF